MVLKRLLKSKSLLLVLFLTTFPNFHGKAQGFHKVYSNSDVDIEYAEHIKTSGNNFVIFGKNGEVDSQYYILKVDRSGTKKWVKKVNKVILKDMTALPDSGVIFGATAKNDTANETDIMLYKLNKNGNLVWKKMYYNKGNNQKLYIDYVDSATVDGQNFSQEFPLPH